MTDTYQAQPPRRQELTPEDRTALRATYRDISDLDPATVTRAHEGFRRAYDVAQRVVDGNLDPLSA